MSGNPSLLIVCSGLLGALLTMLISIGLENARRKREDRKALTAMGIYLSEFRALHDIEKGPKRDEVRGRLLAEIIRAGMTIDTKEFLPLSAKITRFVLKSSEESMVSDVESANLAGDALRLSNPGLMAEFDKLGGNPQ